MTKRTLSKFRQIEDMKAQVIAKNCHLKKNNQLFQIHLSLWFKTEEELAHFSSIIHKLLIHQKKGYHHA